ncbi:MAG: SAM-dependent methyltransferase [Clostridiales bacterium]|nr:SAM-dependent methyltransferase [Clostridiales bacterium]
MLDERLSLAASLYEPCDTGADIGTDHGLLPCHVLKENICRRMIFADVSPKALRHAEEQVGRQDLAGRARLICADGLDALVEKCGCVSVMGMGGETIASILTRGHTKLQGAVLVLSAHTDLHLVRQAVRDIGYHIVREELCRAAGRFYVVWRAEPGAAALTDAEIRFGPLLMKNMTPMLKEYITWRIAVLGERQRGLLAARELDVSAIRAIRRDIAFYQAKLEE